MRDSLSALDQAIAAFGKHLEAKAVRDLLGAIPSEMSERVLGAVRDRDPAAMLAIVDDLFQQGRHPQHFCGELTRHFRNLMVMKFAGRTRTSWSRGNASAKRLEAGLRSSRTKISRDTCRSCLPCTKTFNKPRSSGFDWRLTASSWCSRVG